MLKIKLGLCKSRHDIEGVHNYVFPQTLDPTNLSEISRICRKKMIALGVKQGDQIDLYVTGLSVALVDVINYCIVNQVQLNLYHYNRDTGTYYKQVVHSTCYLPELRDAGVF